PFRSAWAVLAAAGIYGDIAREVERRGAAAIDARVVTGRIAKADWVIRAWYQARGRARLFPVVERDRDLWRRSRLDGLDG
ncbi:MAG: phytoene/squalene synthase family protein, partial [Sphingomonadaceae bacterium]|nr:phytoene/squalene synthase family protein [Sphingomonadaceae bacterium]